MAWSSLFYVWAHAPCIHKLLLLVMHGTILRRDDLSHVITLIVLPSGPPAWVAGVVGALVVLVVAAVVLICVMVCLVGR